MTDFELIKQTFDKVGIKYVWHDDNVPDCNCGGDQIHIADAEMTFWFDHGKYAGTTPY